MLLLLGGVDQFAATGEPLALLLLVLREIRHGANLLEQIGESVHSFVLAVPTIGGGIVTGVERAAAESVGKVRVVAKVFTKCAACTCKQAHVPRFAALVGVDRVDEPDRLSFSILRVDADPCRPHVVLNEGAQRRAHGCGQVRGVSACFTALVNVYDENGSILLVGQHCVLALGEGLRLNAIHPRAAFAVFVGVVGLGEVSRVAGVNDVASKVSKQRVTVVVSGRGIVQSSAVFLRRRGDTRR